MRNNATNSMIARQNLGHLPAADRTIDIRRGQCSLLSVVGVPQYRGWIRSFGSSHSSVQRYPSGDD